MSDDTVTIRVRALDLARFGLEMDHAAEDVRKPGRAADESNAKFDRLNAKLDALGRLAKLIRPAALITGLGAAAGAASSLTAGAIALGGALLPASGALAAYPALGSAAAQGLGVFKLATADVFKVVGGLNQELNKNSSAFKKLSPEAQRFAVTLDKLKEPFRALPALAQKAMLPGFSAGLKEASKNIGVFKPLVTATGGALGKFAEQAGKLLGNKGFGRDLQAQGERNVRWMSQAGTMALNLFSALRHLTIAAGPLVSWMMKVAVGWSNSANQAARAGRESGKLASFFDKTRAVLTRLFSIGKSFAQVLWNIGKAGAPLGNELLGIIQRNAKAFTQWTGSAAGQNKIARFFAQAKPPLMEAGRLIRDIVKDFLRLGSGSEGGLTELLRTLRTGLLPALLKITQGTTKAFGPVFVKTVTDFVKAFEPMVGSSGPLILFLKTLDMFAKATLAIEKAVPGLSGVLFVLANAMLILTHVGMARFVSQLMGAKKGIATVRSAFVGLKGALDTAKLGMEAMRAAYMANTGAAMGMQKAADISNLAVLRAAAAAKLQAAWSKICAVATRAWTVAQAALDAVMDANPVVLVVVAIAALVAAVVLAYKKVSWFRDGVNAAFGFVKHIVSTVVAFVSKHWKLLLPILFGPFGLLVGFVASHFDTIVGFVGSLPGRIAKAAVGMWDGIKDAFRSAIDWIIQGWDSLHFRIPGFKVGPIKFGGFDLGLPQIPMLAKGGTALRGGSTIVGEHGPEMIDLPQGASVQPLGARVGDDLAEKIAAAIAKRMPTRPLEVRLFDDRVGHGLLRWLEDQAVGVV